jgi:hypothetical protein
LAENIIRRLVYGKPVSRILVVGNADIDASPVMQYLLKAEAVGKGMTIESAGLSATGGESMSPRALEFLSGRGANREELVAFRSRKLSDKLARDFELLLVTSMAVKGFLLFLYPDMTIYTFSEYALIGSDVGEMRSAGDSDYFRIGEEMAEMAKRIVARAIKNTTF